MPKGYLNLKKIARIDFLYELYYYQANKSLFKTFRGNNHIFINLKISVNY
jgi:hypothetical protein